MKRIEAPMEDLVSRIGTANFIKTIFNNLHGRLGVRYLVVCEYLRGAPVRILSMEGYYDGEDLDQLMKMYMVAYFRRDPAYSDAVYSDAAPKTRQLSVHYIEVDEIDIDDHPDHRPGDPTMIANKAALVLRNPAKDPDRTLVIVLVRDIQLGRFKDSQKKFIRDHANQIVSAVDSHFDAIRPQDSPILDDWAKYLQAMPGFPNLSQREALVCAYSLLGYSNEAAALNMSISAHSVTTYRRRAYQKLRINSQNQLFSILFFAGGAMAGSGQRAH